MNVPSCFCAKVQQASYSKRRLGSIADMLRIFQHMAPPQSSAVFASPNPLLDYQFTDQLAKMSDMNYKNQLLKSLREASFLVNQVNKGKMGLSKFINEYDNYYYSAALDGHEANSAERQVLAQFQTAIDFQQHVQLEVVDMLYVGNIDSKELVRIGRIGEYEAFQKLRFLSKEFDLEGIINSLGPY